MAPMPESGMEPLFDSLTVGSLFTGIGGLDLGLERAGMHVVWQSEVDPYACRVLARHWPDVPNLGDVTTIDWSTVERPDLVCGGYPCQPFSLAGVRRGEGDPRHLWPHFARCLRHLRPRWALLENVPGHLSLGFGRVLGDLAELGYDTQWDCVPAAAVGAPHLRYRVFVVCRNTDDKADAGVGRVPRQPDANPGRTGTEVADATVERLEGGADGDRLHAGTGRIRGGEPARGGRRIAADVAHAAGGGSQDQRQPSRTGPPLPIAGGDGADVPDAAGGALAGDEWREGSPLRPEGRGHWAVEPDVRGISDGFSQGLDGGLDGEGVGSVRHPTDVDAIIVRVLRQHRSTATPPHGRGPDEQLAAELADALRAVSHPLALEARQEGVAQALSYLHGLREACEAVGAVRDASVPIAAAWQSLSGEAQAWAVMGARRGTWHTEWPNIPRVATGVANRVDRLRTLGNAVVPQVAEWIGRRIMEAAA